MARKGSSPAASSRGGGPLRRWRTFAQPPPSSQGPDGQAEPSVAHLVRQATAQAFVTSDQRLRHEHQVGATVKGIY
ncbi:hypothetical protein CEXT_605371 [Caerostris extrusa]|uniref:PIN domain-containing protein n=1 Tax=Caerostris extrusa TaxID=172846 RepID=A0AAV4TVX2_CAEEX|nr:hypothetical protein CEXT_605371 [Caerostris extrusa]